MDTLPRSLMQLLEIARFEIGYRLRRASTWFFAVLLIVLPLVVLQALASEPQHLNSPLSTATAVALIAMVGMLVTAAIFGDAATRDADTGMRPLFYTAPLGKLEYLGGRFLGALVVNAGLLFFIPIALLLGTFLPYENVTFGPFIPGAYIEPIVTFALPNLIFTAAILFTVAALTRSTLPAYLAAVGLFIAYLIAVQWARRLASRELAMLFDPFGSIVIQHLTGYLSPVEKDTVRLGLPPILLFNRLLWVAIGGAVLAFLAKRFQFELGVESGHRRKKAKGIFTAEDAEVAEERQLLKAFPKAPAVEVLSASSASSAVKNITQTLSIARIALTEIIASRTFRLVLAVAVIMVFAFGWDVGSIVFDTSTWPLTHLVASVMRGPAAMTVVVLIAVYAGELIWRERDVRVASMADTTPVATWVPLAGKFLALIGMLLVLQTTFLVSGLLLQVVRGYYVFELGLYIKFLFGFLLATYVLFAALAVAAHVVVDRKHLGHIVVALFFAFFIFGTEFTLSHNLLRYGSDPGWVYSDMNGFGPFVSPFIWFKLYWGAWALLLGVIAALLYVRGAESGWRQRIAEARLRLSGGVVRAAVVAVVLIAALGGFIFYNTTVLNEYSTDDEENAAAAEYEKRFGVYRDAPVPVIVDAKLRVDIHPERAEVDLAGTYTMVNRTTRPIDSVHVVVNRNVKARSIELDRTAQLVMESARRHLYRIYALERALVPGDTLRLTFDHRFERRGFPNSGINTSVAENGAYFDRNWLPRIGYEDAFELTDEYERKKHGLTPRTAPGLDDPQGMNRRYESRDADAVSVDAVIGTAEDQIAITPGTLVREWRENGRRYFHYKTDSPLMFGVPVLSARYAVREDKWNDVALKIFHHPTHTFNLDRMIRSMKASLEYFSREYGPYQFGELRIVEFPRYASFARAHPHTIAYSEGGAFLTRVEEGDVDRPFFVTAHEIAHQWWGGQLSGARVPGVGMISETLAQYGAMMVMEKTYGRDQVKKFYDFELDGYLRARGVLRGNDVPLIRVWDQSFIYYNKGAVAMYTLKEQIGEERVNAALRAFLNTHRDARPPYATSRDLYRELQAVTPDSLQDLLVDLFETITLWDVRVKSARAEQTGPSSYRVAMDVVGKKVRADSMGVETEVPMNDIVEIAVFAGNERPYFEKHRIRSGEQRITLTVSRKPESVGVDPYHDLIQRVKDGKVVSLDEVSATPWKAEYRARSYDSTRVRIPLPNF